jgi:hypothetical protein
VVDLQTLSHLGSLKLAPALLPKHLRLGFGLEDRTIGHITLGTAPPSFATDATSVSFFIRRKTFASDLIPLLLQHKLNC